MKRVAVTGASGYVGTRLVRLLAARGDVEEIVALDLRPPRDPPPQVRFNRADVTEPFAEHFRGVDAAVHLAYAFSPALPRHVATRINLDGTRHFLAACAESGVSRAVVVSSATAYGARADNPPRLVESDPLRATPAFQYAHQKRLAEALCDQFAAEMPGVALTVCRPAIVVGAGVDNHVSRMLFKPKVLTIRGSDPPMQFVHEDDLASAIVGLLDAAARGRFNVAPVDTLTFGELAATFERAPLALPAAAARLLCGLTFALRLRALNESPPGALDYVRHPWVVDAGRIAREIGWQARFTTKQAVAAWRSEVIHKARAGEPLPGKVRIKKAPPAANRSDRR